MRARVRAYLKVLDKVAPRAEQCAECEKEGRIGAARIRGLCMRHYQRLLRYGDAGAKPKSRSAWM